MSDFVGTSTERVSRRAFECTACDQPIPKGTAYWHSSGMNDGYWWTWREHLPCHDVTQRWLMNEPDGLDAGDFSLHEIADTISHHWPRLELMSAIGYFEAIGLANVCDAITNGCDCGLREALK